jgi:hypothetical protein
MVGEIMEVPGETYLFNLSLIAVTFTAVSALVMLLRQTMGGKLSNFDVYLITSFISFGFAIAISALLPPLASFFELSTAALWAVSSGLAAIIMGSTVATNVHRRHVVAPEPMSWSVRSSFVANCLSAVILLVNAVVQPWQGVHMFAGALTLSTAAIMWAFVRRIGSLVGDKPGDDWDPKRG